MAANEIARVYAKSIVEIGKSKGTLDQLFEELELVAALVKEDSGLRMFLTTPNISKEAKKEFIRKTLAKAVSDTVQNLLFVLIDNGRQDLIPDVCEFVGELIDEIKNRQAVTIISSEQLDSAIKVKIQSQLKTKLNKEIIFNEVIDKEILGGIIIKIGDMVINGSLIKDLNNIKKTLLNSKVRSDLAYEN